MRQSLSGNPLSYESEEPNAAGLPVFVGVREAVGAKNASLIHVCFTPKSGHSHRRSGCPLIANCSHIEAKPLRDQWPNRRALRKRPETAQILRRADSCPSPASGTYGSAAAGPHTLTASPFGHIADPGWRLGVISLGAPGDRRASGRSVRGVFARGRHRSRRHWVS